MRHRYRLGPALGTPLVAWWGIEAVLVIDAVTLVVAAATSIAVRFDEPGADTSAAAPGVLDDGSWQAAFAFLRRPGRPLVVLVGTLAATNLLLAGFNISLITIAIEVGGASRSGVVMASGGLAMLAGSLVLGVRGLPRRRGSTLAGSLAVVGVGCFVAGSRPVFAVLIHGTMAGLAAVPVVNAAVGEPFEIPPSRS